MKTFSQFNNSDNEICPLCGTSENKDLILIPIVGTTEGQNTEAIQVHVECLLQNCWYFKASGGPPIIAASCDYPTKKEEI